MMYPDVLFGAVEGRRRMGQFLDFIVNNPTGYPPLQHAEWAEAVMMPGVERGDRFGIGCWQGGQLEAGAGVKIVGPDEVELCFFRSGLAVAARGTARYLWNATCTSAIGALDERKLLTGGPMTVRLDTPYGGEGQSFFEHLGFVVDGIKFLHKEFRPHQPDAFMSLRVPIP